MIEHKTYFDGKVQSLSPTTWRGKPATAGVIVPREEEYDFGPAKTKETIYVTSGEIKARGVVFTPGDEKGIIFLPGEPIRLHVPHKDAAYLCVYG